MKASSIKSVRCAIYTRVSTEHGLDQEFNSLDAQYEAASAYIKSQAHAGWTLIRSRYDDGGYSGGSTDRPDLQRLLDDIRARKITAPTLTRDQDEIDTPQVSDRGHRDCGPRPRWSRLGFYADVLNPGIRGLYGRRMRRDAKNS